MKKIAVILLGFSCSIAAIARNPAGEIHGFVVDPQGHFVAGATVRAQYVGVPVFGSLPQAQTDRSGQFTLSNVSLGEILLMTMKEGEGYPDASWSFYHPRQSIRLTLSSEAPRVDAIRLMLEPKAAVVVGTVSDAVSGAPLNAIIHMWRADNERDYIDQGVSGHFTILVPADNEVRRSVRAPGHQEWFNTSDIHELHVKLARTAVPQ